MADLKSGAKPGAPLASESADLGDQSLVQGIELLFYAYRYFTADPDAILERYGFGRAHHRVLHFVSRHPGITVAELLGILRITKQSLSRVLGALVAQGHVMQRAGERDRRQRRLQLTPKGAALEREIATVQRARVARAYERAGPEAVAAHWKVLEGLIDPHEREAILRSIRTPLRGPAE